MTTPVIAVKTLSIKAWGDRACPKCNRHFDIEPYAVRMAPDVPLTVSNGEEPFAVLELDSWTVCPHCKHRHQRSVLGKPTKKKKVALTLLIHPEWLKGSPRLSPDGMPYGGAAQDDAASTAGWNLERASHLKLLEVRGELPEEVICPDTGVRFYTDKRGGTVPKKSTFTCAACGTVQDVLKSVGATGKAGQMAPYALQGFSSVYAGTGAPYGGRFFAPITDTARYDAAAAEWERRRNVDLSGYWPDTLVPPGFKTSYQRIPEHGYPRFSDMFNDRQLYSLALLLKSITEAENYDWRVREYVLGAFQQFVRNNCMFSFWHEGADKLAPSMSNNNYHPKSNVVEVGIFPPMGYGPWSSTIGVLWDALDWSAHPWEVATKEYVASVDRAFDDLISGKSVKIPIGDQLVGASVYCTPATSLGYLDNSSIDLLITDPPFGNNIQYAELADFFYVWLRLVLRQRYPAEFESEVSPRALEAVSNRVRAPEGAEAFYQRILTQCWREVFRVLKPGGILAFTFHHSEDDPWVAVLESLFDAGFYLEATYPIRSDETKGEGAKPGTFGSQLIEYDIIHVCRKRLEEPTRVSWAKMRREVLQDVRQLQQLLEHHAEEGLPAADLQVIRRGKALEYFSRHYGQVYVNDERQISVKEALVGINQLIDEEAEGGTEPPPGNAEPLTRQFLRIFDGKPEQNRDQVQKYLRGTGVSPDEYADLGWCEEDDKVFSPISPMQFAQTWHGRHRRNLVRDYDQAMVLIGACFENSGINAADTVKNENFAPRPSLKALLDWFTRRGNTPPVRTAAARAFAIYQGWERSNETKAKQLSLFEEA